MTSSFSSSSTISSSTPSSSSTSISSVTETSVSISLRIASIASSSALSGAGTNILLVRILGRHATNLKSGSSTLHCASSLINSGTLADREASLSGIDKSRFTSIDIFGDLVQSRLETLRRNFSWFATASRIVVIISARFTGSFSNISLTPSIENPCWYHSSISSTILPSNLSMGIPECRLLVLASAIRDSNSASVNDAVGRSSAKPLLTKSIQSVSSIERCLAPLRALVSMK